MSSESTGVFPNFLGIGCPRSGTTWLHEHITSHPHGFTPQLIKEVHYYDEHFDRGREWYLRYFREADPAVHRAIGEVTPHYLYSPEAAIRAAEDGIENAILIVREPVKRLWSNYLLRRRSAGFRGTFEDFIAEHPAIVGWGDYASHLAPWQDAFGDRLLILVYEHMMANPALRDRQIGSLLGLDPELFAEEQHKRVNPTINPRFPQLTSAMVKANAWLVARGLEKAADRIKRQVRPLVLRNDNAASQTIDDVSSETITELRRRYEPSIAALQESVDIDIDQWWISAE